MDRINSESLWFFFLRFSIVFAKYDTTQGFWAVRPQDIVKPDNALGYGSPAAKGILIEASMPVYADFAFATEGLNPRQILS